MRNHPEPGDDIIDSRDIIKRIEELQGEHDDLSEAVEESRAYLIELVDADEANDDAQEAAREAIEEAEAALAEWEDDYGDELQMWLDVQDECHYGDWTYGATLVHESYWVQYVQEMLEDCGDIPRNTPSYIVIDWEATAENIAYDYTTVEIYGDDYYIRNC